MRADPAPSFDGATACAHCALPVPPGRLRAASTRSFCCEACRTVYEAIHEQGLERFYAMRGDGATGPARRTDKSYAEMDDPSFLASACSTPAEGLAATDLYLEGVHCAACVWLVERVPRIVPGVLEVRLDLSRSRARVTWDRERVPLSRVARLLDSLGYPPHPFRGVAADRLRRAEDRALLGRIGLAGAVAGNVMAIGFALYGGILHGMEARFEGFFRWASLVLTIPSFVWCGGVFFRGAAAAIRTRTLHMDVPIAIGLTAGFLHGVLNTIRGEGDVYFDAVATLIFLLLVGRFLQRRQQRAAADAAELLASLAPSSARVIAGASIREIPLEALVPGMRVVVRAGEVIPADGRVASGRSNLDLSLLSGESRPIAVAEGDGVHAGTLNLASPLEIDVESTGEQTRVGRLMRLVEDHQRRRAPIVQLADRISGVFVAAVLTLAAATFAIWAGRDLSAALDHATALLIVTCPCALGLATPLALSVAIGQAARSGILIRGGDALEKLTRPGRMWLDKTGTLTEGRLALLRFEGPESIKPRIAAAEAHSAHPVARAFTAAWGGDAACGPVEVRETIGGGIEGRVGRDHLVVGSPSFVGGRAHVGPSWRGLVDAWIEDGMSPVLVASEGEVVAAAAFGDPLREEAAACVERVRRLGWRPGILSGDHPGVVKGVARRLGIDPADARGAVSPEAKLETVAASRRSGSVAMVGDGVNDAAALAAATVGVGVHGGAEATLQAADVYITRAGIAPLTELLEGARRTMRVVRRNLVFSLVYNAVGVALAMSGVLNPLIAAILMPLSSLTVIASSFRARMFRSTESRRWR